MNRDQALDKIKKCLRLSKSNEPHEAATALRQAQALAREHAIDLNEAAADVAECAAKSGATETPVLWELSLARMISESLGCDKFFAARAEISPVYGFRRWGEWLFIGIGANPQIAAYSFDVLRRQALRARAEYIAKALRRCRRGNKTSRADKFSLGWVIAIKEKVIALRPSDQELLAIEGHINRKYPDLTTTKGRRRAGRDHWDGAAGYAAGQDATLNHGVDAAKAPQLEHRR